jgi:hypothetical protein
MPSFDELLGLSSEELRAMTDAEMLERWKDSFDLEPKVEVTAYVEKEDQSEGEADGEFRKTITKKARITKAKNESSKLKDLLGDIAGLETFLKAKIEEDKKTKDSPPNPEQQ